MSACYEVAVTVEEREEEVGVFFWRREVGWWGEMVWGIWCSRCVLSRRVSLLVPPLALVSHFASPLVFRLPSVLVSPVSPPATCPVSAAAGPVVLQSVALA